MELKQINISKDIRKKITTPIPDYLIQERDGGGGMKLSYLSGSTITDMLNNYFGYSWNWEVKQFWIQESQPAYNKYVNGKYTKDSSQWTLDPQGPVAHVLGTLTVQMTDEEGKMFTISKDGFGSKSVLGKQNDQESIFKAAGTDALKKAASLLGIGLELYRKEDEQYYFDEMNYENPWTEEELTKYAKEWKFINNYIETYGVTDEQIGELVFSATGVEDYYILPHNIEAIYNYLVQAFENAETQDESEGEE